MANTFKVGDRVKTVPGLATRLNGIVKYVACYLATTAGGKKCDKKTCPHINQDNIWVLWPGDTKMFSYHYSDLRYDAAQPSTQPTSSPSNTTTKTAEKSSDATKDEYLSKTKDSINKIISASKQENDFFKQYNGFTTIKYDRYGKPFLHDTPEASSSNPIENKEVDWEVYTGLKKGSIRKILA